MNALVRTAPVVILVYLAGVAGAEAPTSVPQSAVPCQPSFPYQEGWLGGDAAYSIPLPDGRSFWIFGDSLVAGRRAKNRKGSRFVSNSIALSSCDAETGWDIRYYWGNQYKRTPKAFFDSGTEAYAFWPGDGFVYRDSLYVALMMVKKRPDLEMYPFEYIGVRLAKASGLAEPPERWRVEYYDLFEGKAQIGGTAVVEGDYVYLFGLFEDLAHKRRPMILTRIALEKLDQPAAHLEYLAQDNTWKPGVNPSDAFPVMEKGHSELTVRYHADQRKWVAVMMEQKFLAPRILVATAPALTGPWLNWTPLYEFAEVVPTTPGYDRETFCYAGKEHIQFARANELLLTYACNSFNLFKMLSNMNLYRPQPVWVTLSPEP